MESSFGERRKNFNDTRISTDPPRESGLINFSGVFIEQTRLEKKV